MTKLVRPLGGPLAVRSSAVDEDGAEASFAGQHLTLLNVTVSDELTGALSEIWWSANSDSAITYRQRVGLFTRPSVGVVVQVLVDPDTAGVMFTQNPINGADERVIEASWGLGEAVVAGRVIPDHYRVARSGEVLERHAGAQEHHVPLASGGGDGRGGGRPRARRTALSRRPPARGAERPCRSLRAGLRAGSGHRVGERRRDAVPVAVQSRHEGGA